MTQKRALEQIERILATVDPAVLSTSGRWRVGKINLWGRAVEGEARINAASPLQLSIRSYGSTISSAPGRVMPSF